MNQQKFLPVLVSILMLASTGVFAQATGELEKPAIDASTSPNDQFSGLPLDLLPPGARALGLGGAFTAVADDATAALANPAGMTNLTAPEVSLFVRYTDADVRFLDPDAYDSGRLYEAGDLGKTYSDSATEVSYASFVYPVEDFVFSAFYSNQLDFTGNQSAADVVFDDLVRVDPGQAPPLDTFEFAYFDRFTNVNAVRANVENLGLSAAWRFSDEFSIGLTVRRAELDLTSQDSYLLEYWNDWEANIADIAFGLPNGRLATVDEVSQTLSVVTDFYSSSTVIDDSDTDWAYDLGLYYRGDQWSFGLVYHAGASFSLATVSTLDSAFTCNAGADAPLVAVCEAVRQGVVASGRYDDLYASQTISSFNKVELPSVIALGVAWRPSDTWLLSLDINHVEYSVLNAPRNRTLGFNRDINDQSLRASFYDSDIATFQGPLTENISDEFEYHLGVEKSFVFQSGMLRSLALRGGAFTIEDHDGIAVVDSGETVWTVGIGSTWGKSEIGATQFLVDLGAGFADDTTNIVLSGMVRF